MQLYQLNNQQQKAVQTTEGPVLLLAGPGSGKSFTLTHRTKYLIKEKHVPPGNILILTFTNKAAEDMKSKINKLLINYDVSDVWMGTFHSIGLKILMKHLKKMGYKSNFSIYDNSDSKRLIKIVLDEIKVNFEVKMVLQSIQRAKRKLVTPYQLAQKSYSNANVHEYYQKMALAYDKYENRLQTDNAFDFNDLIKKPIELFQNYPKALKLYQNKFQYIQIDEFQDTNQAQYQLVSMLAKPENNLFVVGDDSQTLFSWRGADIRNIMGFKEDYPKAEIIRLEQNYRSSKTIVRAANAVIKNNEKRMEKTIWTDNEWGLPVVVNAADSPKDEANFIAETISSLVEDGYEYQDIAVLYRNNYQSEVIEKILLEKAIPCQVIGGNDLMDRKEIKDIISYLRIAVNPDDQVALRRIIKSQKNGVGRKSIDKLGAIAARKGVGIYNILQQKDELKKLGEKKCNYLFELKEMIEKLQAITKKNIPLKEKVCLILQEVKYKNYLKKKHSDTYNKRIKNIMKFLQLIEKYNDLSLQEFLIEHVLTSDGEKSNNNNNKIKLMTIHASKGGEWSCVFTAGLEEDILPHKRNKNNQNKLEEERRLFYVAITRAEKRVFISHCRRRKVFSKTVAMEVSRFIAEIPDEYIKHISNRKGRIII